MVPSTAGCTECRRSRSCGFCACTQFSQEFEASKVQLRSFCHGRFARILASQGRPQSFQSLPGFQGGHVRYLAIAFPSQERESQHVVVSYFCARCSRSPTLTFVGTTGVTFYASLMSTSCSSDRFHKDWMTLWKPESDTKLVTPSSQGCGVLGLLRPLDHHVRPPRCLGWRPTLLPHSSCFCSRRCRSARCRHCCRKGPPSRIHQTAIHGLCTLSISDSAVLVTTAWDRDDGLTRSMQCWLCLMIVRTTCGFRGVVVADARARDFRRHKRQLRQCTLPPPKSGEPL